MRTRGKGARGVVTDRRGGAVVEFAFGFALLAIMAGGIIDLGRAVLVHHALTDGARAAARYLARVADPCSAEARAAALNLLVTRRLDGSDPPVFADWPEPSRWTGGSGHRFIVGGCGGGPPARPGEPRNVTVSVRVPYEGVVGMLGLFGFEDGLVVGATHDERRIGL
jgi:hypothetical protein